MAIESKISLVVFNVFFSALGASILFAGYLSKIKDLSMVFSNLGSFTIPVDSLISYI